MELVFYCVFIVVVGLFVVWLVATNLRLKRLNDIAKINEQATDRESLLEFYCKMVAFCEKEFKAPIKMAITKQEFMSMDIETIRGLNRLAIRDIKLMCLKKLF